nr:hypothetical protein RP007_04684 [Rhizobium sp. P007]
MRLQTALTHHCPCPIDPRCSRTESARRCRLHHQADCLGAAGTAAATARKRPLGNRHGVVGCLRRCGRLPRPDRRARREGAEPPLNDGPWQVLRGQRSRWLRHHVPHSARLSAAKGGPSGCSDDVEEHRIQMTHDTQPRLFVTGSTGQLERLVIEELLKRLPTRPPKNVG